MKAAVVRKKNSNSICTGKAIKVMLKIGEEF